MKFSLATIAFFAAYVLASDGENQFQGVSNSLKHFSSGGFPQPTGTGAARHHRPIPTGTEMHHHHHPSGTGAAHHHHHASGTGVHHKHFDPTGTGQHHLPHSTGFRTHTRPAGTAGFDPSISLAPGPVVSELSGIEDAAPTIPMTTYPNGDIVPVVTYPSGLSEPTAPFAASGTGHHHRPHPSGSGHHRGPFPSGTGMRHHLPSGTGVHHHHHASGTGAASHKPTGTGTTVPPILPAED